MTGVASTSGQRVSLWRWFRQLEPRVIASLKGPMFDRMKPWLDSHDVFNFNRKPLALGVAIGLFCGLIPGPLQVLGTLLLCAWWRGNIIAGAAATVYTNPLTIVPLYVLAFEIGQMVLPGQYTMPPLPTFSIQSTEWMTAISQWVQALGWPLAVGLPVLAFVIAVTGWLLVQALWLAPVVRRWNRIKRVQKGKQTHR
jgi:uncharacterized protein